MSMAGRKGKRRMWVFTTAANCVPASQDAFSLSAASAGTPGGAIEVKGRAGSSGSRPAGSPSQGSGGKGGRRSL